MKIVQGLIGKLETFPFDSQHAEDHDAFEGCSVLQNYNLSLNMQIIIKKTNLNKSSESFYVSIFH